MVKLEDVEVIFNQGTPLENHALRSISLNIEAGEFVTVIGSNGAGKSTLLNTISGEIRVTSGSLSIANELVTYQSVAERAHYVARVFQDPMAGTCEALTIEENLALAFGRGKRRGFSLAINKEREAIFKNELAKLNLGLEKRLADNMGLLSGGQRQAVSLLMTALRPSKILLLDEHTAALDPKTAKFITQLTEEIIKENDLTALMVTHSMQQALEFGNRTIMLHQGEIILDIKGEARKNLTISDLLNQFEKNMGEQVTDDALLLG